MSSIRSASPASMVSSFASSAPPFAGGAGYYQQGDIPLAPMPPWGLANAPAGLTAPVPSAPAQGLGRGRCIGGCIGFFTGVGFIAAMVSIACTGGLGTTFAGETWAQAVNSGYYWGDPDKPQYTLSDQCVGVGLGLGLAGTLLLVPLLIRVGAGLGSLMGRGRRVQAASMASVP